jgi:hypothetical protein
MNYSQPALIHCNLVMYFKFAVVLRLCLEEVKNSLGSL